MTAKQDLVTRLRVRVGWPDDEQAHEVELENFLLQALDEVNHDRPATSMAFLTTVADTPSYNWRGVTGVPANAYAVKEVYYSSRCASDVFVRIGWNEWSTELGGSLWSPADVGAGSRVFDNPAMATAFYKKVTAAKAFWDGRWERGMGDDTTIWLAPTPSEAKPVYFTFTHPRFATVEDVRGIYQTALLLRAEAFALDALSHKRSDLVSSSTAGESWQTGGGVVQQRAAQAALERYQREFSQLPVGPLLG